VLRASALAIGTRSFSPRLVRHPSVPCGAGANLRKAIRYLDRFPLQAVRNVSGLKLTLFWRGIVGLSNASSWTPRPMSNPEDESSKAKASEVELASVTGDGGESYWTPLRRENAEWLRSNAPPLAEVYEGALKILFAPDFPGKLRFVAHAMREIVNRLPDALGAAKGSHVDYAGSCNRIETDWVKHGLPTDGTVPGAVSDGAVSQSGDVSVPRSVYLEVAALVMVHSQRGQNKERAGQFLDTIDPDGRDQHRKAILARDWTGIGRWTVKRAHLPSEGLNNKASTSEEMEDELLHEFERLEAAMGAFFREFFSTTDEIDKILEDANS